MSGNLWMFSDMLDDEDIEMQKHDFITLYQGADYYGLGLKVFTRMAREAGSVYKIGKKVLIRRTIFDEYLRKVYKKELEKNSRDDSGKELVMRQGTKLLLPESEERNSGILCASLVGDAHKERSSGLNCTGRPFFRLAVQSPMDECL